MPYDESLKPASLLEANTHSYSPKAMTLTPGATDQTEPSGAYFKYMTAAAAGTFVVVPMENDDADTVSLALQGGQVFPGQIRRVVSASAGVIGWYD